MIEAGKAKGWELKQSFLHRLPMTSALMVSVTLEYQKREGCVWRFRSVVIESCGFRFEGWGLWLKWKVLRLLSNHREKPLFTWHALCTTHKVKHNFSITLLMSFFIYNLQSRKHLRLIDFHASIFHANKTHKRLALKNSRNSMKI